MIARRIVLTALLLAWCRSALALNPALDVSQYAHTAWNVRDGFVAGTIQAIAQTPDGYLWLGTDSGLLRFDGVKTTAWRPPSNQSLPSEYIISLLATPDGVLWIGTDHGLASWNGRTLTSSDRLAGRFIYEILRARDGTVWVTNGSLATGKWTLCAVRSAGVTCYGEDGGPGAGAIGLHESRDGTLWVGTRDGVWRWKPGAPRFFPIEPQVDGFQGLYDGDAGSLHVVATSDVKQVAADGRVTVVFPFPKTTAASRPKRALRDRDGGIWMSSSAGLVHVHQGTVDVLTRADGLTGAAVIALFEDREGNLWVATSGGLDRFSDAAGAIMSSRQGMANDTVLSLLASRDGTIWAATAAGLQHFGPGASTLYPSRAVTSIFEDRDGRIWAGIDRGVAVIESGRLVDVAGLPGGLTRAIVEDSGYVWVINQDRGVFRVSHDTHVVEHLEWIQSGVSAAVADPATSGIWVGFAPGGVAHYVDGRIREAYSPADGLGQGRVRWLSLDVDRSLWIATEGGLSRLRDGHITTWNRSNGLPCDVVLWIVEDARGALWLSTNCGVVRVDKSQFGASIGVVHPAMFDTTDGVRTSSNQSPYTAPAVTSDGRIWLSSPEGICVIDPQRIPYNRTVPGVHIEQMVADHREVGVEAAGRSTLPALTRDLEISYTALSLTAPEKNRFRYKLEGYDSDWQDAGNRRQAFYTHLPPRAYRFRVIASNNSGVWNETGASLDFVIPPAYYQTTWFATLVGGMFLALAWTAYRVRVRVVERHEREISALNERLMKAQEQERIRIAGELHDGVMQQMLAMTMMLGTTKRKAAGQPDIQASIEKIQQKVIQTGTDIRQLSHGLHPPLLQDEGLPGALRSYCEQFGVASDVPVTCDIDETARELSRGAALALFRITQEALGNAAKHAKAKHVTVKLGRANGTVALTVSDDGVGFDRSRLGTSGGLGLVMMRERAGQLNGTFEFESAPGRGTTIRVAIPFR